MRESRRDFLKRGALCAAGAAGGAILGRKASRAEEPAEPAAARVPRNLAFARRLPHASS